MEIMQTFTKRTRSQRVWSIIHTCPPWQWGTNDYTILQTLCKPQANSFLRAHILGYNFYEISRIGKFTKKKYILVLA